MVKLYRGQLITWLVRLQALSLLEPAGTLRVESRVKNNRDEERRFKIRGPI